ncbi:MULTISPECIES: hypothetical protein [Rhizobium]|jgi:hypothetical protein|nr:hypothetical protein [Rhizobium lusitanum]NTJ11039.1 hypothetical protein [Rhizobium lusitanum]
MDNACDAARLKSRAGFAISENAEELNFSSALAGFDERLQEAITTSPTRK